MMPLKFKKLRDMTDEELMKEIKEGQHISNCGVFLWVILGILTVVETVLTGQVHWQILFGLIVATVTITVGELRRCSAEIELRIRQLLKGGS